MGRNLDKEDLRLIAGVKVGTILSDDFKKMTEPAVYRIENETLYDPWEDCDSEENENSEINPVNSIDHIHVPIENEIVSIIDLRAAQKNAQ